MKYKEVIITGASSGIGQSMSRGFLLSGATVHCLSRNITKLNEDKNKLPIKLRKKLNVYKCDISNEKQVNNVIKKIFLSCDPDLIINNAGIGYCANFTKMPEKKINQIIDTNIKGTINITRESLLNRRTEKVLHIVNVSSLAGKLGFPDLSVYSASKFAIEGLTDALRREYSNDKVYFTVLRPGITDTDFFKKANMKQFKKETQNLKSFYSPDKVARIFIKKINLRKREITIGNDIIFLKLFNLIPYRYRFKFVDIINKI